MRAERVPDVEEPRERAGDQEEADGDRADDDGEQEAPHGEAGALTRTGATAGLTVADDPDDHLGRRCGGRGSRRGTHRRTPAGGLSDECGHGVSWECSDRTSPRGAEHRHSNDAGPPAGSRGQGGVRVGVR